LALSSRNEYLDSEQRRAATILNGALSEASQAYDEGERNTGRLVELVRSRLEQEPLARIDYVSVNDAESLETLDRLDNGPALMSLAVFVGETRLIDNVVLGKAKKHDAAGMNA
jgi:pantoate--beta-alanine ligase